MTESIGFFIPIRYQGAKTIGQNVLEKVEDYFSLGSKVAHIIPGNNPNGSWGVEIKDANQHGVTHYLLCAIKIISYCTPFFISAIMRILKADGRFGYQFEVIAKCSFLIPAILFAIKTCFRFTHKFHVVSNPAQTNTNPQINSLTVLTPAPIRPSAKMPDTTVASLMEQFTKAWDSATARFNFSENFDLGRFTTLLTDHAERFEKKGIDDKQHYGYIEKFDLDPAENPQIYMRADLHGDLKSLIENLRSLQEQKLLDNKFKCQPGVHLVFLGDYCDRDCYGTQILEVLMRLREENPQQVHLIRGNHEYTSINFMFGNTDTRLTSILREPKAREALERFYKTMSLTTYLSVAGSKQREYIQCTHGLFEPTMDPILLLDQGTSGDYIPVPQSRKFSARVQQIPNDNSELSKSAQKVKDLVENQRIGSCFTETLYNWGDVTALDRSCLYDPGDREYRWCAQDIHHYFRLSSEQHHVMMLLRGHAHAFQHVKHNEKVIVTTLTVGVDSVSYAGAFENQSDRAYIIKPASKVENWTKKAILRAAGHSITDEITASHPLISAAI